MLIIVIQYQLTRRPFLLCWGEYSGESAESNKYRLNFSNRRDILGLLFRAANGVPAGVLKGGEVC